MEIRSFVKQYIQNPRTVGAVAPSSEKLANRMVEDIDFSNTTCIVEYGPGTGVFTEKILNKKKENTIFIAIEFNNVFYKILKEKFCDQSNFILINDSAENLKKYLNKYQIGKVDYIVSGLPYASLPDAMSKKILTITKEILKGKGKFITFQYSLFKMKLFRAYFNNIERKKVVLNLPPAFVLTCEN